MTLLSNLKNTNPAKKNSNKRVGRGIGTGKGKTCGRGTKGAKARSGYKRRTGQEGGQLPIFRKIPIRGFSRGRFQEEIYSINVNLLDKYFADNEVVSEATLREKKLISVKREMKVKILGNGEITKAIKCEVNAISRSAKEKIEKAKGSVKLVK